MSIPEEITPLETLEEMAPRNLGRVLLPWTLLRQILHMPGIEIRDVQWDPSLRAWDCVLEGQGMPEVGEADMIPAIKESYEVHKCGHECDFGPHEKLTLA